MKTLHPKFSSLLLLAFTCLMPLILNGQEVNQKKSNGLSYSETTVNGFRVAQGQRPPIDLSQLSSEAFETGRIRVKVTPMVQQSIQGKKIATTQGGYAQTGIASIDQLNEIYKVTGYKPILADFVAKSAIGLNNQRNRHQAWGFHLWYELEIDAKSDVVKAVKQFGALREVEHAEPVYAKRKIGNVVNVSWVPDDPQFNKQWHYLNTGQSNGIGGKDINLIEAWEIERGHQDVVVAIIDDGIQFDHPDLAASIWSGLGYNFADNSPNVVPGNHGTHVAGTVAAVNNNGIGVSGVAGGSNNGDGIRLMSCQVFSGWSSGGFELAPIYAADNGAAISQNSWGYTSPGVYEEIVLDAIDYFNANGGGTVLNGGITIFASGNDDSSADYYPGYYQGTLSVSATNNRDEKAWYSNYGAWVDISAPGGETSSINSAGVLSTVTGSSYEFYQGTSMACPHVSGVAALLVSYAHRHGLTMDNTDLWDLLVNNTDNHYTENPNYIAQLGSGRLNANSSLIAVDEMLSSVKRPNSLSAVSVSTAQIDLSWIKNDEENEVLLVYSADGNFSLPVDGEVYEAGDPFGERGNVIYKGSSTEFSHIDLVSSTKHFYRAFSFNSDHEYSTGRNASANTLCDAQSLPFYESFESGEIPALCWSTVDGDSDGRGWVIGGASYGPPDGSFVAVSASNDYLVGDLTPDNWLISPQFTIDASNVLLRFFVKAGNPAGSKEKFSILVSNSSQELKDFSEIYNETLLDANWKQVVIPINGYLGQEISIAFRHWDCIGQSQLIIDNISFEEYEARYLTFDINPVDAGSVLGDGDYYNGELVTVSASPNPGFIFANWMLDDVEVSRYSTYSFEMPTRDIMLVANFTDKLPEISVEPAFIEESIFVGNSITKTLTITNTGDEGSNLLLSIAKYNESEKTGSISELPVASETHLLGLNSNRPDKRILYSGSYEVPANASPIGSNIGSYIFFDDFENGVEGWYTEANTLADLWHVSDLSYSSPSHALWCGLEGENNYENGQRINNAIISPTIHLPIHSEFIELSFWENFTTEIGFDLCKVDISTNDGISWTSLRPGVSGSSNGWVQTSIDLKAYAGEAVRIRFYFDTTDDLFNNYPGWFIDDVGVLISYEWINFETQEVNLAANESFELSVILDAINRIEGVYETNIRISSNDLENPVIDIPVSFDVMYERFALTVAPNPLEGGVITGEGNYYENEKVTLEAIPNEGFMFVNWTLNEEVVSNARNFEFTMPGHEEVLVANFTDKIPVLTVEPESIEDKLFRGSFVARSITLSNTGDEGSTLTVDVNHPGSYNKNINNLLPELIHNIPENRDCYYKGSGSKISSNLTVPTKVPLTAGASVLYLSTKEGLDQDFKTALQNLENVGFFAELDAISSTPNVDYLLDYDIVVVSSGSMFSNAVLLGNNLADYVDAGGRVCLLPGCFFLGGGFTLEGRIMTEEYMPLSVAAFDYTANYSTTFIDHPITSNVHEVGSIYWSSSVVQSSGISLGQFESGHPVAAYHTEKPVVAINIDVYDGIWSGDLMQMVQNTIDWFMLSGWLKVNKEAVSIPWGGSYEFEVILNATSLAEGFYESFVRISSNDPGKPIVDIPISLEVEYERFVLGVTASPDDGGIISGEGSYYENEKVTLEATPNTGFMFVDWTLNEQLISTSDSFEFTMPAHEVSLVANFTDQIPEITVEPISLNENVFSGHTLTDLLTISNTAFGNLIYEIEIVGSDLGAGSTNASQPLLETMPKHEKGANIPDFYSESPMTSGGGPDGFGYSWSVVPINWMDATSGTAISLGDDSWVNSIPLGFEFEYYGQTFSEIHIMSNGWVSFSSNNTWHPSCVPGSGDGGAIVPFGIDLYPPAGGNIYYQTQGMAPNRKFIVEYNDILLYGSADSQTFQVVFHERTGVILFQYLEVTRAPASIGVESPSGIDGMGNCASGDLFINPNIIENNIAIKFNSLNTNWLSLASYSGSVFSGEEGLIDVTYNARNLEEGVYESMLRITSNDPNNRVANIPVSLTVEYERFSLTVLSNPIEGGVVVGEGNYYENDNVTLEATAEEGFLFVNWTLNEELISTSDSFEFTMPAYEVTLVANFTDQVPELAVEPGFLNEELFRGQTSTELLTISNTGLGNLLYEIEIVGDDIGAGHINSSQPLIEARPKYVKGVAVPDIYSESPMISGGGPDEFGYSWFVVPIDWMDASSGTSISLSDDSWANSIPLGFEFEYYGQTYSSINIMSNGWVSFSSYDDWYPSCVPGSGNGGAIVPFGMDLFPPAGGNVYYQTQGMAPNRRFVIEFNEIELFNYSEFQTFQVVFHEQTGVILFQYLEVTRAPASIGVESPSGIDGMGNCASGDLFINPNIVEDGLSIELNPLNSNWLSLSSYSGSVLSQDESHIEVTFDARNLVEGVYESLLRITSNDPKNFVTTIPITLTVDSERFALTVTGSPACGGIINGQGSYYENEKVTLEAIPNEGCIFECWTLNEEVVSHDQSFEFIMPGYGVSLTANFMIRTYKLTINTIGNGWVEVGGNPYSEILTLGVDSVISLAAFANDGWQFEAWSEEVTSNASEGTLTMDGDKLITAFFSVNTGMDDRSLTTVKVFPNPFSTFVTVNNAIEVSRVIITNMIGLHLIEVDSSYSESITIPADQLAEGVYLITLFKQNGDTEVLKIVKRK